MEDGRTHCSSFPAGIEGYLETLGLEADLFSGLALYGTALRPAMEPFSKNVFRLLHFTKSRPETAARQIAKAGPSFYPELPLGRGETFKIWAMEENVPRSPAAWGLRGMEEALRRRFMVSFDPMRPLHHFYMIKRKEGFSVFLYKENIGKPYLPAKGQLSPEIAYAMCRIAGLGESDTLLDPFSGRDSVPIVASRYFGCRNIFANDLETEGPESKFGYLRTRQDFLSPSFRLESPPTKIVTDPPWGMFSRIPGKEKFYTDTLAALHRNLSPAGLVVMLIPNDEVFDYVGESALFRLDARYNILVNGKKALIVRLAKSG